MRKNRINRNILECKGNWQGVLRRACEVLIETYWNVKILANIGEQPIYCVLIETYWNVKELLSANRTRINVY